MEPECTNLFECASDSVGDTIKCGGQVFGFFKDQSGRDVRGDTGRIENLASGLLPALTSATLPDLLVDWFLSAYAILFATAVMVMVMVMILLMQLVRAAHLPRSLATLGVLPRQVG